MKLKQMVAGLMGLVGSVFALTAQATDYYWGTSTSGNWSDVSNWYTDAECTTQATKYPNATGDYPRFNTGTTANITLTENITVSSLDLSAENLNLTFSADETAGLKLTLSHGSAYLTIGANTTAAFDGIALARSAGWTLSAGATLAFNDCSSVTMAGLTVQNGGTVTVVDSTLTVPGITLNEGASSFRASGSTLTVNYPNCTLGAGATLELADGTQMTAGASSFTKKCFFTLKGGSTAIFTGAYSGGGGAEVTIDDSTLWGQGFFYLGYNGGGDRYVFKGNNPVMKGTGNYFRGNSDAKVTSSLYFDFEVPVGGFAEPPVQNFNAYKSLWMNGTASNHPVYIRILETSPAKNSTEYKTTCPLVYSPYGIYLTLMSLDASDYTYTKLDGTKATDNASSKYLNVTLGSGDPAPTPTVDHSSGVTGRTKVDVSRRTFTVTSDVTALATTGTTRARLLAGETKTTLAEVSTTAVTAIGELSFVWTAPTAKLNNTYYFQIVLETLDGDGQVVYSETSPVASATTQDTTVYTWQAVEGVWDGNWTDKAHWAADTGDDRLDYPQTSSCQIEFPANQSVTITVDQSLNVGKMKLNKNGIDVTLVNAVEDKTQNKMTGIINCDGTYDCSITFKYLEFRSTDNTFPGSGKKIRFENGYFWTYGYYQGKGTTELYLKDSTCYIGSYVTISSDSVSPTRTVTLDNSQMTVVGNFAASYNKYGKILFKGQNPKLYLSSADKTIFSELDGVDASFEFEIPEGGFTEPPISCVATATKKAFNDTKALPAFNFVIMPTSPALLTAGDSTYPLMTWAPGITTGRVNFDGVVSKTDTFLYGNMNAEGYDWQPVATSTLANPTAVGVKIHGLTSTDIVTVQGNPGDFGTASPAYGQTTGHTAGETATYSVPEPTFTKDGVNYSVSGYVVSNVLADLSYEFAYEGKSSSFEYTHPANATVITWLWGRSFALAVNAAEGGTVSPTSKICAEGAVVEVTATPDATHAFFKWTGDVEGIADVTQPKISVTMDRARTLTANFGLSVKVDSVVALTNAVATATDGSTITVAPGNYWLTNGLYLANAVKVVGETGNPEDVIIHGGKNFKPNAVSFQVFTLNHAEARVEAITVEDAYLGDNYFYGAGFRIATPGTDFRTSVKTAGLGGTVVNCIVRNSLYKGKFCNAAIFVNAANGFVDRCVITNNVTYRQSDSGSGAGSFLEVANGGVVRNTLIADNANTADAGAASVYVRDGSSLINCTVVNNTYDSGSSTIGGVQAKGATDKVVNCVIAGNVAKSATASDASWAGCADSFAKCAFDAYAPNDNCYAGAGLGLKSLSQKEYRPITGSACIDFGSEANYGAYDLDGTARVSGAAVDAGCYEFDQNQLAVGFTANVLAGFAPLEVTFTPAVSGVSGEAFTLKWDFNADGTVDQETTDLEPVAHTYDPGVYSVCLTLEVEGRDPASMTIPSMISVGAKTLYVDQNSTNPVVPYDTPEKAAKTVQDAIDAAIDGAEVRIFDGDYQLTKSIMLEKAITVTSVSGKKESVILRGGRQKNQAFIVLQMDAGANALVHSLTIADGLTTWGSTVGGIKLHTKGGVVSNCVVTGSAASWKFDRAGGIYASGANALVTHCVLSNNFGRAGYSDGANPSGSAIALFSGARCEHTLITQNVMGAPNGSLSGIGPSQNTVHVGANSYLRFCTVVSNDAYYVAGVNVENANAHVEYCVIAGNHSRHADEMTYGGAANGGKDNATADQVNRWHVWGVVGDFSPVKSGAAKDAVNRDDYVCTQERANATAAVAAAFKTCSGDTVKINDTCKQVQANAIFRNYERGNLRIPYGTAISDLVAPADLTAAGVAMPAKDVFGKPRLRGEKYDIGAIECQMSDGTLLLVK